MRARHLHIYIQYTVCTFRWLLVVLIEWDVLVVVFAVDISLRESVISNSVAVHQRRAFKGYELSVIMIFTILHVMHQQKMNIKYQREYSCRCFSRCPTAEMTPDTGCDLSPPEELPPSSRFSRRHIHYTLTRSWLTGWLHAQAMKQSCFILFFFFPLGCTTAAFNSLFICQKELSFLENAMLSVNSVYLPACCKRN